MNMNLKTDSMGSFHETVASKSPETRLKVKRVVAVAMALWFAVVFLLGAQGAFTSPPGSPPLRIFLSVTMPLVVFFTGYVLSGSFRTFVLGADLRLVAAMQGWRWAGLGFLSLYAHGVLPALFAFPAGLGDMAIGVTAPWIVLGLIRQPAFATSRRFVFWNIMGITDLVVAVSLGALSSGFIKGLTGNVTAAPMAQLPLVLIPAYLVPLFLMLHFTALTQARKLVQGGQSASA